MTYREAYSKFMEAASLDPAITNYIGPFQPSTDDNNKIISEHIFRESSLMEENANQFTEPEQKFLDAVEAICDKLGFDVIPDNDFQSFLITPRT